MTILSENLKLKALLLSDNVILRTILFESVEFIENESTFEPPTLNVMRDCAKVRIINSVMFCISNVFHNEYPFVLILASRLQKGYSVVSKNHYTETLAY